MGYPILVDCLALKFFIFATDLSKFRNICETKFGHGMFYSVKSLLGEQVVCKKDKNLDQIVVLFTVLFCKDHTAQPPFDKRI